MEKKVTTTIHVAPKIVASDEWVVYCTTCKVELDRMRSGVFAEATAKIHIEDNPDHLCLVSLEYSKEEVK